MLRNKYFDVQLSQADIDAGAHREFVGAMWDEIGELQFKFMVEYGLKPHHKLLDLGCGALRGGVHFVRYLDPGNYYGVDCNASLLEAGERELAKAGLADKSHDLLLTRTFDLSAPGFAGVEFDYALAFSLFTHLPPNWIIRCLKSTHLCMKQGALLYASVYLGDGNWGDFGGIKDPYLYTMAELINLSAYSDFVGLRAFGFGHPRGQVMWELQA